MLCGNAWGLSFGFDIWANLLSAITTKCAPPNLGVGVNTKNQISDTGFVYDAAGNFTFDGSLSVTYDAENRIISTNAGVTYTYDGDGRRVKKSNGKLYWYGGGSEALEETELSGTPTADYIFFNGKRTARLDLPGAVVHYYFSNHLGSASVVTDALGTMSVCPGTGVISGEEESDYYPFGGERVVCDRLPDQDYKFTGKERDTESGLDFFIARYYTSQYGRFLSPDEFTGGPVDAFSSGDPFPPGPLPYADITDPQSLNKHTYTFNNPLCYIDPEGHDGFDFVMGVINAVGSNGIGAGRQESYNADHAAGQAVGDVISVGIGLVEMVVGSTAAGGGVVACGTVVGCLFGGATATAAGVTVGVHGVGMAANGFIQLAKSTGTIYVVPGSGTSSGRPYVGRHNKPDPTKTRRANDGRDRKKAKVVDRYDPTKPAQGRRKEQKQIDARGLDELDNRRNEIQPKIGPKKPKKLNRNED